MNRYNAKYWNTKELDINISMFTALVDNEEYEEALKLAEIIKKDPGLNKFPNKPMFEQYLRIAKQKIKE